jgi:hypothetical protein
VDRSSVSVQSARSSFQQVAQVEVAIPQVAAYQVTQQEGVLGL